MASPEQKALARSRKKQKPNNNFNSSWDLGILGKVKGWLGYGSTCTNTATSFYYPNRPTAGSNNLINNPQQAGFRRVNQKSAVPGSIIVMQEPNGQHRHTVIYDSVYKGPTYTNQYGDVVQSGDTLINYSNGGKKQEDYKIQRPMNTVFPKRTDHRYFMSRKFGGKL